MKHLKEAQDLMGNNPFLEVKDNKLSFIVQDGPVKEVGVTGLQAVDILEYCKHLFTSLNKSYSCRENSITITKIEEALHWQTARTKDRVKRKVEGKSKL